MDPQDRLRASLDGVACSVCDAPVPVSRVRLLARRDDLAFIEIDCGACGSAALGFVADPAWLPAEADRLADAAPITPDDVLEMHDLLEGWSGDLRGLLGDPGRDRGRGADAIR